MPVRKKSAFKKPKQPALKRGGMVVGAFHHENSGGPKFQLGDTGQVIEEEGFEFNIPEEIANSKKKYTFTKKKNVEIIHEILKLGGLSAFDKVTHVKSGDIVICIKSAWDDELRTITGTVQEILSAINTSCGCKHIADGAKVKEHGKDDTTNFDSIIPDKDAVLKGAMAGGGKISQTEHARLEKEYNKIFKKYVAILEEHDGDNSDESNELLKQLKELQKKTPVIFGSNQSFPTAKEDSRTNWMGIKLGDIVTGLEIKNAYKKGGYGEDSGKEFNASQKFVLKYIPTNHEITKYSLSDNSISSPDLEHMERIVGYANEKGYANQIREGEELPPVIVKHDGKNIDGNHRMASHNEVGRKKILAFVESNPDIRYGKAGEIEDFDNSEKSPIFTLTKITKEDVNQIIKGTRSETGGAAIQAASSYLRGSERAISSDRSSVKRQDEEKLREYISKNNLWIPFPNPADRFGGGGEAQVYLYGDHVIKLNYARVYDSWEDYFNSLLLHNLFFPRTHYELIGFTEDDKNVLYAAVKQLYILTKPSDKINLSDVRKFMLDLGFTYSGGNHYYHKELDIELKDLHDRNVLTKDDVLYFIDTIFYLKGYYKDGGKVDEAELNSNGGYDYSGEANKIAKTCGLVTLPKAIEGTNCGNCIFFRNDFCDHYKILLPVTSRMCCSHWDDTSLPSHFRNISDAYLFPDREGKEFPLNEHGGYDYTGKALETARAVDLITLPPDIKGTTCAAGNCMYSKDNMCIHPKILLPITDRMSCGWWNNEQVQRPWGKPEEVQFAGGGKVSYKQKMKDWQADTPNSPRWLKKKEAIMQLTSTVQKLRNKLTRDLNSDDEKEFLTALAITIMDKTGERVGNKDSADKGHFGVTGFTKKHVKVVGNKIILDYKGKSGVDHEKDFSDERIANALKKAIKSSPYFCSEYAS